jgi:aminoglycoside phosphotransferase (APT) family kinase protein
MSWEWTEDALNAVAAFLKDRGLLASRPVPRRIGDGHSNLTYLMSDGESAVVLRRPPPPPVPKGANDVLREAKVLGALCGTGVPVPKVFAVSQADEVLNVPFYVMEYVPGIVVTDALPALFDDPADRRTLAHAFIDRLADLHAVDWQACGLSDFGRSDGFNIRHLRRIESVMNSRDGEAPSMFVDMMEWLRANIPADSGATIVHNDYRLGNVMWDAQAPPRLSAILDWELATIGDPLLDLGYMAVCYPERGEALTPTQELSAVLLEPGFPSRSEIFERYAARSGRDLSGLGWYAAMAAWKMAVLFDYSHRRGQDPFYTDPTQSLRFIEAANGFSGRRAPRQASRRLSRTP